MQRFLSSFLFFLVILQLCFIIALDGVAFKASLLFSSLTHRKTGDLRESGRTRAITGREYLKSRWGREGWARWPRCSQWVMLVAHFSFIIYPFFLAFCVLLSKPPIDHRSIFFYRPGCGFQVVLHVWCTKSAPLCLYGRTQWREVVLWTGPGASAVTNGSSYGIMSVKLHDSCTNNSFLAPNWPESRTWDA